MANVEKIPLLTCSGKRILLQTLEMFLHTEPIYYCWNAPRTHMSVTWSFMLWCMICAARYLPDWVESSLPLHIYSALWVLQALLLTRLSSLTGGKSLWLSRTTAVLVAAPASTQVWPGNAWNASFFGNTGILTSTFCQPVFNFKFSVFNCYIFWTIRCSRL